MIIIKLLKEILEYQMGFNSVQSREIIPVKIDAT